MQFSLCYSLKITGNLSWVGPHSVFVSLAFLFSAPLIFFLFLSSFGFTCTQNPFYSLHFRLLLYFLLSFQLMFSFILLQKHAVFSSASLSVFHFLHLLYYSVTRFLFYTASMQFFLFTRSRGLECEYLARICIRPTAWANSVSAIPNFPSQTDLPVSRVCSVNWFASFPLSHLPMYLQLAHISR